MDESTHEKANELYAEIKDTEQKLGQLEAQKHSIKFVNTNGYALFSVSGNSELFEDLKELTVATLRKHLAELKIEYRKL